MRRNAYRIGLAFLTLLLLVAANTLVKSTRDAVFLSRFGLTEMSLLAVGLAVVAGGVATTYRKWADEQSRPRLIAISHSVVAASLVGLWLGLRAQIPAFTWLVFVWSSLFGAFLIMQFWLIASELFDVREARRAFGYVGAGAISGGIVGGFGASQLSGYLAAEALLIVAAAMLVVAAVTSWLAWTNRPQALGKATEEKRTRADAAAKDADPHRLVRSLGIALLLSAVATTLLDWQLKAIAKRAFENDAEALASFFGSIFAYQSIASLAIQLLVAPWLLKKWGMGASRAALPLVLLIGALTIMGHHFLAIGLLGMVSAARVGEAAIRYGIERPATELTWLPLDAHTRARGKAFVDTVVDRLGTGLAGALWLGAAAIGLDDPSRVHWVAAPVALTAVGWLWVNRDLQRRYVATFRTGLSRRTIDLEALFDSLGGAEAQAVLREALESEDPNRVRFALDVLAERPDTPLPDLSGLLDRDDAELRVLVLDLLRERKDTNGIDRARALLTDARLPVRCAATRYLASAGPRETKLDPDAPDALARAVIALWDPARRAEAEDAVRAATFEGTDRPERIALLCAAPADAAAELLAPALRDEDPDVVRAALTAASGAKAEGLVEPIADLLDVRRWRRHAVDALVALGSGALTRILHRANDSKRSEETRRAIVRAAAAGDDERVVLALVGLLDAAPPSVPRAAAQALSRLRRSVGARIPRAAVDRALARTTGDLYRDLVVIGRGGWPAARAPAEDEDLFSTALRERVDRTVHDLLSLLELVYPPRDIIAAARGLESPAAATRARGLELLDNVLAPADRGLILPVFDERDASAMTAAAREAKIEPLDRERAVATAAEGNDPWLRAVASCMMPSERVGARLTLVERALTLRAVNVLKSATTEALSRVAQIAEEIDAEEGTVLYDKGDPPEALYVVLSGKVRLSQGDVEIDVVEEGGAFGSWALVDDAPRIARATAMTASRLLRVKREDFADVLADRPEIVEAVFKSMVLQIRGLTGLLRGGEQ